MGQVLRRRGHRERHPGLLGREAAAGKGSDSSPCPRPAWWRVLWGSRGKASSGKH